MCGCLAEPSKVHRLLKIDTKLTTEDTSFLVGSNIAERSAEGDESLNKNVTWIDEKVLMVSTSQHIRKCMLLSSYSRELMGLSSLVSGETQEAEVFDWSLPGAGVLRRCQDPKCSGRGFCNYELGECRCNPGYVGRSCENTAFRGCGPGLDFISSHPQQ